MAAGQNQMSTLPRTAFAMVQTAIRTLEPRDIAIPDIDDDSAVLRLEACGICGSDYEQFEGQLRTPMPVVPGHEPLGRIAKDRRSCRKTLGRRRRRSRCGGDDARMPSLRPMSVG